MANGADQIAIASGTKRRFFRFSLRTLLIIITLCGIWLGYTMHHVRARGRAIRAIDAKGGSYGMYIVGPKWLKALVADEKCFMDAARVSFGQENQRYDPKRVFDDHDLEQIIPHLNEFDHFYILDLTRSNVTDVGMRYLTELRRIEILRLYGTKVTDNCIPDLCALKNLQNVVTKSTGITDEGRAKLHAALPNCKIE